MLKCGWTSGFEVIYSEQLTYRKADNYFHKNFGSGAKSRAGSRSDIILDPDVALLKEIILDPDVGTPLDWVSDKTNLMRCRIFMEHRNNQTLEEQNQKTKLEISKQKTSNLWTNFGWKRFNTDQLCSINKHRYFLLSAAHFQQRNYKKYTNAEVPLNDATHPFLFCADILIFTQQTEVK